LWQSIDSLNQNERISEDKHPASEEQSFSHPITAIAAQKGNMSAGHTASTTIMEAEKDDDLIEKLIEDWKCKRRAGLKGLLRNRCVRD
jgi:hypothetical protein